MIQNKDENFLLATPLAQEPYQNHACEADVIGYRSHVSSQDVAQNGRFGTITTL